MVRMDNTPKTKQTLTGSLLIAGRQWRRLVEQRLAAHGISESRASVLVWLGRLGGGIRQVTLAGYVGIEGASLTRLLDQLSNSGLVERQEDPQDRRANTIHLTPEGKRLTAHIENELTQLRDQILGHIPMDDIEATLRVFEAIQQATEQTAGETSPSHPQ